MTTSGGWLTATIVFFALCNPGKIKALQDDPLQRDTEHVNRRALDKGGHSDDFRIVARNTADSADDILQLPERDLPQERDVDSVHRLVRQVDGANNRVELLLVIDFAAYSQFLARNSGNGTLAIAEIQRYYAGIVSQANERLAKLDLIDVFRLRIILAQIRVFTTAAESSVTEDLNNGDGIINSDAALVNFRTIAISLRPTNPHDYALLVTGYDLQRPSGADTIGITFQRGVCASTNQGVMEENGGEQTATTMAHEIGHTTNANHDAQMNSCPNAFFVMSLTSAIPNARQFAGNPFDFSICSKQEMRSFLAQSQTDCLRSRQTTPGSEVDLTLLTEVELGQQYNADMQCRNTFGGFSRFCRSEYFDNSSFTFDDMCYDMRCQQSGGIPSCAGTLAFDGTSCGDGRWCQDGLCVASLEAPSTPTPTCPQGDDPSVTCNAASCLVERLRRVECCATCAIIGPPVTVSVVGTTTTTSAPTTSTTGVTSPQTGGPTLSIFGQTTTTEEPTTPGPGPTLSIFGQTTTTEETTTEDGGPTLSIFGQSPGTTVAPTAPTGPTLSIFGQSPPTTQGPTSATGPTLSIFGQSPPTTAGPTAPVAPTLSIAGQSPQTTSGTTPPAGPTVSIYGQSPVTSGTTTPAGPTLSINGQTAGPTTTAAPTGPTISVAGTGRTPAATTTTAAATTTTVGTTYSIASGGATTTPPPIISA